MLPSLCLSEHDLQYLDQMVYRPCRKGLGLSQVADKVLNLLFGDGCELPFLEIGENVIFQIAPFGTGMFNGY